MFSFFKDASYRNTFLKGILACIIGSLIVVSRALGRHGHVDETTIYLFIGIIFFAILVLSWVLNNNYKKNSLKQRKK
jgi:hypothetical protein